MLKAWKKYSVRRAISGALAVLIALWVAHYYSFSHEGWLVITAFLVSQTTRGTPLKQSMIYFFGMVLLAMVFSITDVAFIRERVMDVVLGGVIGIVFGQLLFPVNSYAEFSRGMLPLMEALISYSQSLQQSFVSHPHNWQALGEKKGQIEKILSSRPNYYPEWVYEVGFNPALRAGFRFFLIHIEYVCELFFSMHYLMGMGIDAELLSELSAEMTTVVQKNEALLHIMQNYFVTGHFKEVTSNADFTSDMVALEKTLNDVTPGNLDLLNLSTDYITLAALIRDLKDLRGILLQLFMALPTQ